MFARQANFFMAVFQVFFLSLILTDVACVPISTGDKSPSEKGFSAAVYARYAPVKIEIMPLTEFIEPNSVEGKTRIRIYVSLSDLFDCQVKSPCVFRLELYEHIKRSGEPKGKRVIIWPDINLNNAVENNKYWRDFLRAYEFNLDFEPQKNQSYVLQVTCLCPSGKRLSADFNIRHTDNVPAN